MTSSAGKEIVLMVGKSVGYDTVRQDTKGLRKLDPFHDTDPLVEEVKSMISYSQENLSERQYSSDRYPYDSGSERENDDGNIFERLNMMLIYFI